MWSALPFFGEWRTEKKQLEKEMPVIRSERARACRDFAFVEAIDYNKSNLERMSRTRADSRTRVKRKEKEL